MLSIEEGMITRNFSYNELACPCGQCLPVFNYDFIVKLQDLRSEFGEPMIVNSWCRCDRYNSSINGAPNSLHKLGIAVDISTRGWSSEKKYRFLSLVISFGFRGIGIYRNHFHIDSRLGIRALWIETINNEQK